MRPTPDLRCYLVTGSGPREHVVDVARRAVAGGARTVQVRSKPISARDLYALTEEIARAVGDRAHVLVDDRVDVALALRRRSVPVHGVHVGQDDLNVRDVRALLGDDAVIGLTTGTRALVEAANGFADVIDYIGVGPFRPTPTKDSGREPVGADGYRALVELSEVPVVAIGDVTADDAGVLAGTGVAGLAVVRGLMGAADPAAYAQRLISGFEQGRR
ncbi:thiamine phosphate synthase [Corynebacterium comes]|uniref:Thiamine-phosphate synthase n=1 Tax=Corynebacterium comes TaxID=2675218 RepID=A0A6B8VHY4_9CORY|nr:thiamine phosphate synthase [Corynebacterium comes]QGU04912.1 Thiamine-phosphate synthase [Corynebacterium comes]